MECRTPDDVKKMEELHQRMQNYLIASGTELKWVWNPFQIELVQVQWIFMVIIIILIYNLEYQNGKNQNGNENGIEKDTTTDARLTSVFHWSIYLW